MYDKLAPLYNFSQTVGTIIAYFFGEIIPDNDDEKALIADENWKIIYVYFPLFGYVLLLVGYFLLLRHDAVKFLVNDDEKKEEALIAISEVYKHADSKNR